MASRITIHLQADDSQSLHSIADEDLRLPEHVLLWLLRRESKRRGLSSEEEQSDAPVRPDMTVALPSAT